MSPLATRELNGMRTWLDTTFDLLMVTEGMDSQRCDIELQDGVQCPNVAAYLAHCPNDACPQQAFWCETCHQWMHDAVEVKLLMMSCDGCGQRSRAIFPHYKL